MKKIATVVAIIAALAVAGYVCWRYFDKNFKEYNQIAEMEIDAGEEVRFFKDSFARVSDKGIKSYILNENGKFTEIYSEVCTFDGIVFSSANYIIMSAGGEYKVYSASGEEFAFAAKIEDEFISAHQFSDTLYIKVRDADENKTVIYAYGAEGQLDNISAKKDFAFADYCYDTTNGNEFFISYEAAGEYIKLVIRIYNNGIQTKRIEIDNVVYNTFDYISGMFVFYTDYSMFFINTDTLVRRSVNCYDINALEKFIYSDKIVYYWQDAYFDGVNNMYIVTKETSRFSSFGDGKNVSAYNKSLIYSDGKYVKRYDFASSLLDDNVLFTAENVSGLDCLNDVITVLETDKIIFMKSAN